MGLEPPKAHAQHQKQEQPDGQGNPCRQCAHGLGRSWWRLEQVEQCGAKTGDDAGKDKHDQDLHSVSVRDRGDMINRKYSVKQGVMVFIVVSMLIILLVSLGFWQLRRAEEKQHLTDQWTSRGLSAPLDNKAFLSGLEAETERRYQPVSLTGFLDGDHVFLVDNQVQSGKVGYHVLVPMRIEGSDMYVMINRGWVAASKDRSVLPLLPATGGMTPILGHISPFFRVGLRLKGDDVPSDGWPSRVQVVEPRMLEEKLDHAVLPFQILEAAGDESDFIREWQPVPQGAEKSRAYAVQWFSMAAMTLAMLIWYGFAAISRLRKEQDNLEEKS